MQIVFASACLFPYTTIATPTQRTTISHARTPAGPRRNLHIQPSLKQTEAKHPAEPAVRRRAVVVKLDGFLLQTSPRCELHTWQSKVAVKRGIARITGSRPLPSTLPLPLFHLFLFNLTRSRCLITVHTLVNLGRPSETNYSCCCCSNLHDTFCSHRRP